MSLTEWVTHHHLELSTRQCVRIWSWWTGQNRTREDRTGRDGTKLTFKLDFPGNLWPAALAIPATFFSNCSVKFEKEKQETQLSCRCLTFIDHSPDFWTFVETLAGLTSIWYCLKLGHCWTHLFTLLMSVLLDTRLVQIWPHLFALLLRHYSTHLFAQLFRSCHIRQTHKCLNLRC